MIREAYVQEQTSRLKSALQTQYMGHAVRYFEHIESTNTEAMTWAESGAPEGALVIAEYQTQGRGRQGRTWESSASKNLLFSLVLRPSIPPSRLGLITVLTSLAVEKAISSEVSPLPTRIKWPNDILLDGKKCCGMLLETSFTPHQHPIHPCVIIGIGVNVNQESFSPHIHTRPTSLLLETGRHTDRMAFLSAILLQFEAYYLQLDELHIPDLLATYEEKLAYLNEPISLRNHGRSEMRTGIIRGISETGALRFETDKGIELLHAGEVTTSRVVI